MKGTDLLDNAAVAELLAREAEQASGPVRQVFAALLGKPSYGNTKPTICWRLGNRWLNWKELGPFWPARSKNGLRNPRPAFPRQRFDSNSSLLRVPGEPSLGIQRWFER
jgi:hypothetical protein